MGLRETAMMKIRELPDALVEEVNDFVDFLLTRRGSRRWNLWREFAESVRPIESDFGDYLGNLQDYENRLARGEIRW